MPYHITITAGKLLAPAERRASYYGSTRPRRPLPSRPTRSPHAGRGTVRVVAGSGIDLARHTPQESIAQLEKIQYPRVAQLIVDVAAALLPLHQAAAEETGQVVGGVGLRQPRRLHDLAHTE